MIVNKSDLVSAVAKRNGSSKYIVKSIVDDVFAQMQDFLTQGDKIAIRGFGNFEVKEFKSHPAVHPETKERIIVPNYQNVVFRPGDELIRSVREK